MKKIFVFFAACVAAVSLQGASQSLFFGDSYANDTRYDVKKLMSPADTDLCWAVSAANVLQGFQNLWTSKGNALPAGTPNGHSGVQSAYSLDIFAVFVDNWTNGGGEEGNGFSWWFNQTLVYPPDPDPEDPDADLKPGSSGGGYWKGYAIDNDDLFDKVELGGQSQDFLKTAFDETIANQWLMTGGIYHTGGGGHAITLWGYDYDDATGALTGLWICDGDISYMGNFLVELFWDDSVNEWGLGMGDNGEDYSGWYLEDITVLQALSYIPEPSAAALLMCTVLVLFCLRRKKNTL